MKTKEKRMGSFQYRDGSNYKFTFEAEVPKGMRIGSETTYKKLGYTREDFHTNVVRYKYDKDSDHPYVTLLSIVRSRSQKKKRKPQETIIIEVEGGTIITTLGTIKCKVIIIDHDFEDGSVKSEEKVTNIIRADQVKGEVKKRLKEPTEDEVLYGEEGESA